MKSIRNPSRHAKHERKHGPKQIIKLADCPEGYRISQAWRILENPILQSAESDQRSASIVTPQDCVVREPESLLIVNPKSGESKRYPLPAELRRHAIATSSLPDGNLLLLTHRSYSDTDENIVWLTPSGEIAKQQTIRRKLQWQGWSLAAMGWCWAIEAPLPLVNAAATLSWMPSMVTNDEEEEEKGYVRALGTVLWRTWPSMLVVFALACAVAPLAYRRQKRFGLPNPGAWAVFAFVFGVPGWIAYRFHRVWPVLEECPSCRQPSPRDREWFQGLTFHRLEKHLATATIPYRLFSTPPGHKPP